MHNVPLFQPAIPLVLAARSGDVAAMRELARRHLEPLLHAESLALARRIGLDAVRRDQAAAACRDVILVQVHYRRGAAYQALRRYNTARLGEFDDVERRLLITEVASLLGPPGERAALRQQIRGGIDPVRDILPLTAINALAEVDALGVTLRAYASLHGRSAGTIDIACLRLQLMLARTRLRLGPR